MACGRFRCRETPRVGFPRISECASCPDRFAASLYSDSDPQDSEGANQAVIGFHGMKEKKPGDGRAFSYP
jgi:hypothetical protein